MKKLCLTLALLYAPFAHSAYKCVDERGVTLFGDTPPAGCAAVVMYEVTPTGQVLRKIDPTPTPEQLKARLEEQQKKKEADRIAFEQRRKDMALLNTYSTEKEIDVARDRNVEPIRSRIKGAEERIAAVDKRLQEIANEMEFYKAGKKGGKNAKAAVQPPNSLVFEQERASKEKASLEKSIAEAEKEIEAVRARYDADKRRFTELKADPELVRASERAAR
jgi:chromosome segregation ATPase